MTKKGNKEFGFGVFEILGMGNLVWIGGIIALVVLRNYKEKRAREIPDDCQTIHRSAWCEAHPVVVG